MHYRELIREQDLDIQKQNKSIEKLSKEKDEFEVCTYK
jgi:hypothetical protein